MVEEIIELRKEVLGILALAEYYLLLNANLLKANPAIIYAAELRSWIFKIYIVYNDKEAYNMVNKYIIKSKFYQILSLH